MAAAFAIVGYLLAIAVASPPLNHLLPTWIDMICVPIAILTSMLPIDPDAGMIWIIFGGSNAVIYGIIGLLFGNHLENRPKKDDDLA